MNIRSIIRFFRFLSRPARTKRYEILLPLNYNDGAVIEAEKFDQTADELSDRFGGVTEDTVRVTGTWKYGGTRYRDQLFRIRIDTNDLAAAAFFRAMKEVWKDRFRQIGWGRKKKEAAGMSRRLCLNAFRLWSRYLLIFSSWSSRTSMYAGRGFFWMRTR